MVTDDVTTVAVKNCRTSLLSQREGGGGVVSSSSSCMEGEGPENLKNFLEAF